MGNLCITGMKEIENEEVAGFQRDIEHVPVMKYKNEVVKGRNMIMRLMMAVIWPDFTS